MHASTPPTLLFISPIETIANLHQWVSSLRLEAQMKGCCLPTYLPTYCPQGGVAWYPWLSTLASAQLPRHSLWHSSPMPVPSHSGQHPRSQRACASETSGSLLPPPPLSFPPKPSSTPSCPSWFWEPLTHHSSTALALFNHGREQDCLCLPHNLRTEESAWHPVGALYMFVNSNVITLFLR